VRGITTGQQALTTPADSLAATRGAGIAEQLRTAMDAYVMAKQDIVRQPGST